jgi:hypothetical protein
MNLMEINGISVPNDRVPTMLTDPSKWYFGGSERYMATLEPTAIAHNLPSSSQERRSGKVMEGPTVM